MKQVYSTWNYQVHNHEPETTLKHFEVNYNTVPIQLTSINLTAGNLVYTEYETKHVNMNRVRV